MVKSILYYRPRLGQSLQRWAQALGISKGTAVKYADHQPLYRQENIFARAGLVIPRSTLAQWVGTCRAQLQPLVGAHALL